MVVHASYPLGETRVQREAEALVAEGYAVDVLCLRLRGEPPREVINGVKVTRLPVRRSKGRSYIQQFLEYLAFFFLAFGRLSFWSFKKRHDVVQVHNLPDFLVFAALIPRLRGVAIILDLHDLMPEFFASRLRGRMDSPMVRLICWQEKLACLFSHRIISVTDVWRRTLIDRGVHPEKCSVVMNVADSKIFQRRPGDSLMPRDRGFRLLYHGNITERNGIDLLLQAVALVVKDIPDIHLTVHGGGEYLESLRHLTKELNLVHRVRFSTELVPVEELARFITTFNVGVIPYRSDVFTGDILPTKLMEYAALGMPTITSRTPAISSYFDETMVEYFLPGDEQGLAQCLRTLYRDPARRGMLARNIQKFNQRYNWDCQKREYIKLVEKLACP